MSEASYEPVELGRVRSGVDLWPAIEAAQYAHVLDHEDPPTPPAGEAISSFAQAFARWVEEWEQRPREVQSSILDDLGRQLEALAREGLSLYGTTIEREIETEAGERVRMPIALLRISSSQAPAEQILLPTGTETE